MYHISGQKINQATDTYFNDAAVLKIKVRDSVLEQTSGSVYQVKKKFCVFTVTLLTSIWPKTVSPSWLSFSSGLLPNFLNHLDSKFQKMFCHIWKTVNSKNKFSNYNMPNELTKLNSGIFILESVYISLHSVAMYHFSSLFFHQYVIGYILNPFSRHATKNKNSALLLKTQEI